MATVKQSWRGSRHDGVKVPNLVLQAPDVWTIGVFSTDSATLGETPTLQPAGTPLSQAIHQHMSSPQWAPLAFQAHFQNRVLECLPELFCRSSSLGRRQVMKTNLKFWNGVGGGHWRYQNLSFATQLPAPKIKVFTYEYTRFFFKANCIKIKSIPILIAIVSMNIGREEYSSFRGGERLVTEQIRNKKKDYIGGKVRS